MTICESCKKGCCAVIVFIPAILFNLFVLLFPIAGIVMMTEGEVTAGIITLVIGTVFFLGSLIKTICPLVRVFFDVDLEDLMYKHCISHITCCGGCCIQRATAANTAYSRDVVYWGQDGTTISFADGSGRVFTISHPRRNRVDAEEPQQIVRLPVPPLEKSKNAIITECVICYEEHRKIAFIPCGHVVCEECVRKLDKWECHVCRQAITTLVRLYHAADDTGEDNVPRNPLSVRYQAANLGQAEHDSVSICMEGISKLCLLCSSKPPSAAFLPCGHVVTCDTCAHSLQDKECPECHIAISSVTDIFL